MSTTNGGGHHPKGPEFSESSLSVLVVCEKCNCCFGVAPEDLGNIPCPGCGHLSPGWGQGILQQCDRCQAIFEAAQEQVGRPMNCPGCRQTVTPSPKP
jgi:hypothetical protein